MSLKLVEPGKRKNKVYYARGTIRGRRVEESLETGNRSIARKRLEALEKRLDKEYEAGPRVTFAQAALHYMEDRKAVLSKDGIRYEDIREATYMIRLLNHFPKTPIEEITTQAIADAARALYPNVSAATRHRQAVTPARAVLGHHARGGLRQGVDDNARIRWLTPEEAEDLLAAAEGPALRLILTLLGTGCRTSEIVRLQTENINVPTAQMLIADPKNGKPRWAPIEVNRALPALLNKLPAQGAAFLTPKGKPYQIRKNNSGGQFSGIFNAARDAAGLGEDVTPHTLRHTWATWYYAATGHNLAALLSAGGWAKTDMAMRYTKLAPADLASRLRKHGWNYQIGGQAGEALVGAALRVV